MPEIYDKLRMFHRPLHNNGKDDSEIKIDLEGSKAIELTNGKVNIYVSNQDEVAIMQRGACNVYDVNIEGLYEFELLRKIFKV